MLFGANEHIRCRDIKKRNQRSYVNMKFSQTKIPEVILIEPLLFEDERGWFMESFNQSKFYNEIIALGFPAPRPFVQDNHSLSKRGVVRGLHYQLPPFAQGKLVRVCSGSVFDVAVDIRRGSPTFGNWVGELLTEENKNMLWIPEGFAHGFVALEESTQFLYKTTNYYNRESERSIDWADVTLNIDWGFKEEELAASEKDKLSASFLQINKNDFFEYLNA